MHFYNAQFPSAPTALMTPPDSWVDGYRAIQKRLHLERVVVVQPTTYGTDNSCQLEAMKAFGEHARGVMVADTSTSDEELERLNSLGVRGVRFHMLPGGAVPWDIMEEMAARVNNFGWHVQLQMNGREFPRAGGTAQTVAVIWLSIMSGASWGLCRPLIRPSGCC